MGAITFQDLGTSAAINLAITAGFLLLYSFFSVQPINARVFFTKWFVLDDEKATEEREQEGGAKLQFHLATYTHALDWMFVALRKPEREMIAHAGLDMVVFLRMLKLGFKIFVPCMLVGSVALFPTYYTAGSLQTTDYVATGVDLLTISNLAPASPRYWVPWLCAWLFNLWALYLMREEYKAVAQMRLDYLSDQDKSAQQFTVLVRQIPYDNIRTVAQRAAQFFSVLHRDHYLMTFPVFDARQLSKLEMRKEWTENKLTELEIRTEKKQEASPGWKAYHKTGFWGLFGDSVESLEYYTDKLEELEDAILKERERVVTKEECIMPATFVSFKTRWGAAVAAQTQQSKDNTQWITTWAPDPNDVCWSNLTINYLSLTTRKAAAAAIVAATIIFYTIPIAAVQSLATLNNLETLLPALQPVLSLPLVSSFLTSFLPGLALMVFLAVLPTAMRILSKLEGYVSTSQIERAAAGKMFYFVVFSVFFTNVLAGSLWSQLRQYIKNPSELPTALGTAITNSSSFFITYTMLRAWSAVAAEVVRIGPLVIFHIKNSLLVRTPQDRAQAMSAQGPDYVALLPLVELYFLLPFMFWVLAPLYLPFVVVFYVFGIIVYRNQFLNVYSATYDLGGGYWPHFHQRMIACMVLSQLTLICVFILKDVIVETILLIPLPIITILFNSSFIDAPFSPTFDRLALQEAMRKDTIDAVSHPDDDPKSFLARKYLHPSLISAYELMDQELAAQGHQKQPVAATSATDDTSTDATGEPLVAVKRRPRANRKFPGTESGAPDPVQAPNQESDETTTGLIQVDVV